MCTFFLNAIQFTVFMRNCTEFLKHRDRCAPPIYIYHQHLVIAAFISITSISIILIHFSMNICMWQRAFLKITKSWLPATVLAHWAGFDFLLRSSALCRHSGIDCRKLLSCDITAYTLNLL